MAAPNASRFHALTGFLQVASLVAVVAGGVAIATKRAGAQSAERREAVVRRGRAELLIAGASGMNGDAGTPGFASETDAGAGDAAAERERDPLSYAVTQTDADFPEDMSDEARRAIGVGPVPIHREGAFRSALAHPRFGEAARVRVGLVLNNVRGYDIRTGTFEADFFLALIADRPMPAMNLTFTNGNVSASYTLVDAPTLKVYRYTASFVSEVDLRRYPFDSQRLTIEVEDQRAGVDQVVFAADPNRTSLDENFTIAGWGVASIGAHAYRHRYPPRFDRDDLYVSRYKFTLEIDRFSISAAFSVFVPALIIVLISLTGLWMPFEQIEPRSNTGAPMLAAAVLFHFSLMQSLPATGYLTRADKLMLAVYVCLLLNMLSTWAFFLVPRESHARVFRLGRMLVPPASLLIMGIGALV